MTVQSKQVAVGTSATQIHQAAGGPLGARLNVRNDGGTTIFLGGPTVTTSDGYGIQSGEATTIELQEGDDLYGIVAAGSENLSVLVTGD